MLSRFLAFAALAFVGLSATACASASGDSEEASERGRWAGAGPEFLTFEGDALHGSDGCNSLNGSYSRDGDTITVKLGLSTLKACMGVDTWLRKVATATVSGDVLAVFDRTGSQIGTLTRTN